MLEDGSRSHKLKIEKQTLRKRKRQRAKSPVPQSNLTVRLIPFWAFSSTSGSLFAGNSLLVLSDIRCATLWCRVQLKLKRAGPKILCTALWKRWVSQSWLISALGAG